MQSLKKILRHNLMRISPSATIRLLYYRQFKRFPNLRNPTTFNEKIQWMKLHELGRKPIYTLCADKLKVRDYLQEKGYGDLLIPLLGVYARLEDIDFASLPERFVLKWNFGSGYNIVCTDKAQLNVDKTIAQLRAWGKVPYHLESWELQYKDIPRRIICEEYIGIGATRPLDYKFYVFSGRVFAGYTNTWNAKGQQEMYSFLRDQTPTLLEESTPAYPQSTTPPENYDPNIVNRLIDIAERIAEDFPFARVDLYHVNGHTYFGELTFTPGGGLDAKTEEVDRLMGQSFVLPQ